MKLKNTMSGINSLLKVNIINNQKIKNKNRKTFSNKKIVSRSLIITKLCVNLASSMSMSCVFRFSLASPTLNSRWFSWFVSYVHRRRLSLIDISCSFHSFLYFLQASLLPMNCSTSMCVDWRTLWIYLKSMSCSTSKEISISSILMAFPKHATNSLNMQFETKNFCFPFHREMVLSGLGCVAAAAAYAIYENKS